MARAKRPRCARLCRAPIKECRVGCTGTRKERRVCRLGCKLLYTQVCHEYAGATCTPPVLACGATPLTCTLIAVNFPGWTFDPPPALPDDFPVAPGTSVSCGGTRETVAGGEVVITAYLSAEDTATVVTAYAAVLAANGYTIAEDASFVDSGRADCDRAFRITRDGVTVGGLYYFVAQQAYFVLAGNAVSPRL